MPGSDLSQPASSTPPSSRSARNTVSTRVGDDLAGDQREVHALVAHRDAVGHRDRAELQREAAGRRRRPPSRAVASRSRERLHGVISFHDDATPICGLAKSSSPMPTARSMPRAAARSRPSVTSWLRGFIGLPPVVVMAEAYGTARASVARTGPSRRPPTAGPGPRRPDRRRGRSPRPVRTSSPSTYTLTCRRSTPCSSRSRRSRPGSRRPSSSSTSRSVAGAATSTATRRPPPGTRSARAPGSTRSTLTAPSPAPTARRAGGTPRGTRCPPRRRSPTARRSACPGTGRAGRRRRR